MRPHSQSISSRLLALVALASMLALLAGCPPTPTPTPFAYLVRVRADSTGRGVNNAQVTIEVPGRTPLDEFSDVNGLAVLNIPAAYVDQTGKLIVEAAGFEIFRQNITLQADLLPDEVRLAPAAVTVAPTDTATPPSATAPPTATPTPTATPAALTVLNLADGDLAPYASSLLGTYPENQEEVIRVFVVPPPVAGGSPARLYPQSYNHCEGNDGAAMQGGRWEQHIQVGLPIEQDVGQPFEVMVTTATAEGNAAVVAEIQRWCDDPERQWPGFAQLPDGVDEVERISVIRSDELLRAPDPSGAQLPGALRITSPRDGQTVTDAQTISGIYSNVPPDHAIWVLVYTIWGKWLPQSSNACTGEHTIMENGQWRVAGSFQTNTSGELFDVVAVVANREASAFFDQKQQEWCAQGDKSQDFSWPGLLTIELPPGITEKDRIQVVHE